jgi:uncharacterized protein DUF4397
MKTLQRPGIMLGMAIFALVATGITGCSKTGVTNSNSVYTYVTVMNLASWSPSTAIYFNGSQTTQPITAGNYSQGYAPLKPGNYDVQFKKAGGDSLMAEIPASSYDSLNFYTLILYNASRTSPASAIKIHDDFSTISATSSNFRFFNMCPDVPQADLYINNTKVHTNRTVADNVSNPLFNSFQQFTAGTYTIQVKKAGTDSVIASINSYSMQTQNAYTIFLDGKIGSTNPIALNILRASF